MRSEPFQDDTYLAAKARIAGLLGQFMQTSAELGVQLNRIETDRADIFIEAGDVLRGFKRSAHARDLEYSEARYDGR